MALSIVSKQELTCTKFSDDINHLRNLREEINRFAEDGKVSHSLVTAESNLRKKLIDTFVSFDHFSPKDLRAMYKQQRDSDLHPKHMPVHTDPLLARYKQLISTLVVESNNISLLIAIQNRYEREFRDFRNRLLCYDFFLEKYGDARSYKLKQMREECLSLMSASEFIARVYKLFKMKEKFGISMRDTRSLAEDGRVLCLIGMNNWLFRTMNIYLDHCEYIRDVIGRKDCNDAEKYAFEHAVVLSLCLLIQPMINKRISGRFIGFIRFDSHAKIMQYETLLMQIEELGNSTQSRIDKLNEEINRMIEACDSDMLSNFHREFIADYHGVFEGEIHESVMLRF